jgi:deoxycytidine triphosphate deaminase
MARFIDEFEGALKAGNLHDEIVEGSFADFREKFYSNGWSAREPFIILNDRGIKQALKRRLIRSDVKTDDVQIQPASLDCKIADVEIDDSPIELFGNFGIPKHMDEFGLPAYSAADVAFTQHFNYNVMNFHPVVILRSSLGRVGAAPLMHALWNVWTEDDVKKSGAHVANYSPNNIVLERGERFAQILWGLSYKGIVDEDKAPDFHAKRFLDLAGSLESGVEILNENLLRDMANNGLYTISPILTLRKGHIVLHASNEAYRFRDVGRVKLSEKRTDLLEPVDISNGYTPKPGEHLLVKAVEQLKLSDKVAIDFLERPPLTLLDESKREEKLRMQFTATNLVNAAWFDPGYEGIYMAHVKNVDKLQTDIRPGDPIGFGVLFYFPKGVERPYGSKALQSHYQGTKTAQVLQNK